MKPNNQNGFAIVETILVIIIVLALVGTGLYVWKSQQDTNKTLESTNTAAQSKISPTPKTTSTQKYLLVKEWGVKVPLSTDIDDAYYFVSSDVDNGVFLSKNIYKDTDCAADNVSLGLIIRFTSDEIDPETKETYLSRFTDAVKVGNYYYGYVHPQASCDGSPDTVSNDLSDKEVAKTSAYMQSFNVATKKIVKESK